jgi:energy-coupling factor transporter ATP-binding protein EcfA2
MIASNPFSTRYVQPGSIFFKLRDGVAVEQLFEKLLQSPKRRAAIVGPHGSGKSSLLETMRMCVPPKFEVDVHRLNSEHRRFDRTTDRWLLASKRWGEQTIVMVDGFEQLGWWAQLRLMRLVQQRHSWLLVTTHYPMQLFPLLWVTKRDLEDDYYVLRQLLGGYASNEDQSNCLEEAMDRWRDVRMRHPTDMRESLMEMYDWWEKKKRPTTFDSCEPF